MKLFSMLALFTLLSGCSSLPASYAHPTLGPTATRVRNEYFSERVRPLIAKIEVTAFIDSSVSFRGYYSTKRDQIGIGSSALDTDECELVLVHEYAHAIFDATTVPFADDIAETVERAHESRLDIEFCPLSFRSLYFLYRDSENFARLAAYIVRRRGADIPRYIWRHFEGILAPTLAPAPSEANTTLAGR